MDDSYNDCRCGHTRRGHFGGSGRLRDVGTCKAKECACRHYTAKPLVESRRELHAVTGSDRV